MQAEHFASQSPLPAYKLFLKHRHGRILLLTRTKSIARSDWVTSTNMFRTAVPRGLRPLASNLATAPRQAQSITRLNSRAIFHHAAKSEPRTKVLSLCAYRNNTALIRSYASGAAPGTTRNEELEQSAKRRPIQAAPETVSSSSSIHPAFSEVGEKDKEDDTDMMAGIRHDIVRASSSHAIGQALTERHRK